jgi:hypothetical protein
MVDKKKKRTLIEEALDKKIKEFDDELEATRPKVTSASWEPADEKDKWDYRTSSPEKQRAMVAEKKKPYIDPPQPEPYVKKPYIDPPQPKPYDEKKDLKKKQAAKPAAKKSKPRPKTVLSGKQEFFNGRGEENRTAGRSVRGDEDEKKNRTIFSKFKGKNLFSE